MSKFLLWERRSHSISYVGTPFPCVPTPLHHWINVKSIRFESEKSRISYLVMSTVHGTAV